MMALSTCEHCKKVLREESYDAHMIAEHPAWALALLKQVERIASALEDVAAALDRNKLQGYGNFDGK